jgi:hypothetical protein
MGAVSCGLEVTFLQRQQEGGSVQRPSPPLLRRPAIRVFVLVLSSSAVALCRVGHWTEISSISHFDLKFCAQCATSEPWPGSGPPRTYEMLPRTIRPPPSRHEHEHVRDAMPCHAMHVRRSLKAEECR